MRGATSTASWGTTMQPVSDFCWLLYSCCIVNVVSAVTLDHTAHEQAPVQAVVDARNRTNQGACAGRRQCLHCPHSPRNAVCTVLLLSKEHFYIVMQLHLCASVLPTIPTSWYLPLLLPAAPDPAAIPHRWAARH
jgi:hypothetical protein